MKYIEYVYIIIKDSHVTMCIAHVAKWVMK